METPPTMIHTPLLVIGAGPYGLSIAACAKDAGVDALVLGEPMEFWRRNMPERMLLRSGHNWHLDAGCVLTLDAYLAERDLDPPDVLPLPVSLFIEYATWFRTSAGLRVLREYAHDITRVDDHFEVHLDNGECIAAAAVVATPGVARFATLPAWVERCLPPERYSHTSQLVRFDQLRGARCLIVGGRQSAFEWAALLNEAGAAAVHLTYRHDTPAFAASDWSFVEQYIDRTIQIPGWYRNLPTAERDAVSQRFWAEGRLKLEPWLTPRIATPAIHRWPKTEVTACHELPSGEIQVSLSNGERLVVDHVLLATGYSGDAAKVPYLHGILENVAVTNGSPVLDDGFQSSVPGLFFAGFLAVRDFGPFFGFVRGCSAAATLIVRALTACGLPS
jgi:cation diffusion facilitator CzcD-associated flavoprotein CzcO